MKVSVVIRSRDEAPRLRLTLASLEQQARLDEVVVVDDASSDETPAVALAAAARLPLTTLRNETSEGRSAASNRGALAATGDILIFLDGDTLAAPGMVATHRALHESHAPVAGRGETWHLRCTRFLCDPEDARPQPAHADRVAAMGAAEREACRVTLDQVRGDFAAIARRGAPGIYPGTAPAALHAVEMRALHDHPASPLLWAAASGSNFSVPRAIFAQVGGFDPALDINEHRELAYRLAARGVRLMPVTARSYHLTHRSGWRDPLRETVWERRFLARHPDAPLDRLKRFWLALADGATAPDLFGAA